MLYLKTNIYVYNEDRTLYASYGNFAWCLPRVGYSDHPPAGATSAILRNGVPTDLYNQWYSYCPQLHLLGNPVIQDPDYNISTFQNMFPQYVLIPPLSSGQYIVFENTITGAVIATQTGYQGSCAYNSISDFEQNVSPLESTQWFGPYISYNALSGTRRGRHSALAYESIDDNDNINFTSVDFAGVTSTDNSIYIYSISRLNNYFVSTFYRNFFHGAIDWTDPYSPEGESGPGGGDGDYDDETDENPMSDTPLTSFADAGFCRIYSPSLSEVQDLSRYMWTDQTFLQTVINHLKQLIENPMDAIISFSMLPVDLSSIRQSPIEVNVMYVPTGVYMSPVSRQFIDVDCGRVKISKNIGCALDYNPYTKIHAYLPYIGQVTLDTDEVMDKTLHLIYRIDIVTGICAAYILVNGNVMYNFSGHCSISQPLSSADFSGYINAMISATKLVAGVVAGVSGAPAAAAGIIGGPGPRTSRTQETESVTTTGRNKNTGRQITLGTETYNFDRTTTSEGAQFGELASRAASNTVASVMNSKLIVEHTSGFSGNSGYLAQREPYIVIERPRLCNPKEFGKFNGFPSMMYLNLGDCIGYTEVQQVQLTGINAMNPELSEISELLKSGVIL